MIQKELSAVHWPVQLPGMGWIDFLEKELKNTIPTKSNIVKTQSPIIMDHANTRLR